MAAQATVPLEKAKRREPRSRSIREALGIAYFRIGRWAEAGHAITFGVSPCERLREPSSLNMVTAATISKSGRAGWYAAHESLPPLQEMTAFFIVD